MVVLLFSVAALSQRRLDGSTWISPGEDTCTETLSVSTAVDVLPVNERQTRPSALLGDLELSTVEADA